MILDLERVICSGCNVRFLLGKNHDSSARWRELQMARSGLLTKMEQRASLLGSLATIEKHDGDGQHESDG